MISTSADVHKGIVVQWNVFKDIEQQKCIRCSLKIVLVRNYVIRLLLGLFVQNADWFATNGKEKRNW